MEKIRVLIADDHQIMLDGLSFVLKSDAAHIEVVKMANDGEEVMEFLRQNREGVDVAVLDIEMPNMDGVETSRKIRQHYPHIKILVLTMYKEKKLICELFKIGVSGYVLKSHGREELVHAVEEVYQGKTYYDQKVMPVLLQSMSGGDRNVKLTNRETEVLVLIGKGYSSPQISEKLYIARTTVDTHRRNLIEKLDVSNTKGLVRYAVENKYL